jgi:hypothetical protein
MKLIVCFLLSFIPYTIYAQEESGKVNDAFLDSIYNEMDEILEQMLSPKSFATVSIGAGTGFYNFRSANTAQAISERRLLLAPAASYLHKSGFGISAGAFIVDEREKLNAYQYSVTPSFDRVKRRQFSTGIAFTRYFTKKELAFYTTPIQNEAYAYFNYKKPWLQPGVAVAYGWGSRTEFEQRRVQLLGVRRKKNPSIITVRSDESVRDFSSLFSLRHDFYFSKLFSKKDLLSVTPVVLLSAGTQSFGFNTSFQSQSRITSNFLPNNQYVREKGSFDTQSTTLILRADYSVGILFIQSQVLLDYYLHTADDRFNNAFSVIAGINF